MKIMISAEKGLWIKLKNLRVENCKYSEYILSMWYDNASNLIDFYNYIKPFYVEALYIKIIGLEDSPIIKKIYIKRISIDCIQMLLKLTIKRV